MYIFRLPTVRYALWAVNVAMAVIAVLYVIKLIVTPVAWTAVHHQLHLPDRVGTEPFDDALTISGNLVLVSIVLIALMRATIVTARFLNEVDFGFSNTIDEVIENSRWHIRRNEERKRAALAGVFSDEADEAIMRLTTPEQRAVAVAKVIGNRNIDTTYSMSLRWCVLEELVGMSPDLERHLSFVTFERPTSNMAVLVMSDDGSAMAARYEPIVNHLGGTITSTKRSHGFVVVWDEPHTPYLLAQFRLYIRAADLIACESAGKEADRLHDELAAEARLWSYKGYRVAGGDYGTTPEAIERAAMIECQQVLSTALLASTPEVVSL